METSAPDSAAPVHTTNIVAWDVPATVVAGERFHLKIGIKCSGECRLSDRAFTIYDHHGVEAGGGTLSGDVWPGTTGLYVSEVQLEAPADEGLYTWCAKGPSAGLGAGTGSEDAIAHGEASISFGVRVVSQPEHLVRIEAVDHDSRTPLSGAHVVMHPYKAVTDERGVTELRVTKGVYTLFVSRTSYMTWGVPIEVMADITTRAELQLQPERERN